MSELKKQLIEVVQMIPYGKVTSYGKVGQVMSVVRGKYVSGQLVGWTLSAMPQSERTSLPWWRVVTKQGVISSLKLGDKGIRQIKLLKEESIVVHENKIDMSIYNRDFFDFF